MKNISFAQDNSFDDDHYNEGLH
jgi:hypothetical protein